MRGAKAMRRCFTPIARGVTRVGGGAAADAWHELALGRGPDPGARYDGAREQLRRTAETVAVLHGDEVRDMIGMVDAFEAFELRRNDARELLAKAFAAPRARQFYETFDRDPRFGALMCALALEHGVEVDFVRRIIELHRMPPPANAGSTWPWPVRIHTLGGFALSRAGVATALHGNTQKKPLELLKALVASGPRSVDKSRLARLLCPMRKRTTQRWRSIPRPSRLRKMLVAPEAIRIEEGKVAVDREQVWVTFGRSTRTSTRCRARCDRDRDRRPTT